MSPSCTEPNVSWWRKADRGSVRLANEAVAVSLLPGRVGRRAHWNIVGACRVRGGATAERAGERGRRLRPRLRWGEGLFLDPRQRQSQALGDDREAGAEGRTDIRVKAVQARSDNR